MNVEITAMDVGVLKLMLAATAFLLLWMYMSPTTRREFAHLEQQLGLVPGGSYVVVAVFVLGLWLPFMKVQPDRGDLRFVLLYVMFMFGVGFLALAASNVKEYILAVRTETSAAGMGQPGLVEVSGEVTLADDVIETPFTGTEAVCYKCTIEEKKRVMTKRGREEQWTMIHTGEGSVPFYVHDGTGEVLIDPAATDLRLPAEETVRVDEDDDIPGQVREYIVENPNLGRGENDRRYNEARIEPGDEVYVIGEAAANTGATYPSDPVIGASGDYCLVAMGSVADVKRRLRRTVIGGSFVGLALVVVGYGGLFRMAGVV